MEAQEEGLGGRSRSGSETRQRTRSVLIRFDEKEFEEVQAAASRAGLTVASYGRGQMLSAPPPRAVRRPPVEKEMLARLLGQLGKAGGNLNQVARAANRGSVAEAAIEAAAYEVRAAAKMIMAALGRPA